MLLGDPGIIELMRVLLDDSAEEAMAFLRLHFKGKARELLEAVERCNQHPRWGDVQVIGHPSRK